MTGRAPLRRSRIRAAMRSGRFDDVLTFGVVISTNDVARRLAVTRRTEDFVVIADGQTSGRGRRGNAWLSTPESGLFVSASVAPLRSGEAHLLAGAAGVAAAEAICSTTRLTARIKWPNDLWIRGRKVGGVLIEVPGGDSPRAIIGIGITLLRPKGLDSAPGAAEVDGILSFADGPVSREALAASLLDHLDASLTLAEHAPEELRRRYRALDVLVGREILAETPEGLIAGCVTDVDLALGIDLLLPDRSRKTLRPEHTHIVSVFPESPTR